MSSSFRIVNGRVYDPINDIDGLVQDICVQDGKIVDDLPENAPRIDVSGMVIMPGGVDMHSHIAGGKVNLSRKLQPEENRFDYHPKTPITRSGTGGTSPSTRTRTRAGCRIPAYRIGIRTTFGPGARWAC